MLPDGLLQTILDEPGDDTPRLIYADWLDEHGQPERAVFIRAQCRIAREPPVCVTGRLLPGYGDFTARCRCPGCSLRRREYTASRRHIVWDWLGGVGSPFVTWAGADDWRRGFVYRVRAPCADFLRHAGALFACQPVQSVVISDKGPSRAGVDEAAWFLLRGGTGEGPDDLPAELFDALPGGRYGRVYGGDACLFTDAPAALASLSARCVAYGREQARKLRHVRQGAR